MINDIQFGTKVEARLSPANKRDFESVRANGFRIGIRNPVFFLRNPDFWYNTPAYTETTTETWIARVISHESLHATLENVESVPASRMLDVVCNRGGWFYEDTGIPHEYSDYAIRIGMLGLEGNTT